MFIADFLKYTFLGKIPTDIISIDINLVEESQSAEDKFEKKGGAKEEKRPNYTEQTRNKTILFINWVLGIICLGSFTYIIVHNFINQSAPVPKLIEYAFTTTLGYFGGAFSSFFK